MNSVVETKKVPCVGYCILCMSKTKETKYIKGSFQFVTTSVVFLYSPKVVAEIWEHSDYKKVCKKHQQLGVVNQPEQFIHII